MIKIESESRAIVYATAEIPAPHSKKKRIAMVMNLKLKHILVSRTDNIGDVVLTLPIAAYLKKIDPELKVSFLARDYTQPVIELSPHVDHFISWDKLNQLSPHEASEQMRLVNAQCCIHAFPKKKIAKLAKSAAIPYRVGTSRRWYHTLTCNKKINLSHKMSLMHEAQCNLALLKALGYRQIPSLTQLDQLSLLTKPSLCSKVSQLLKPNKINLIIHPFSNNNGREWPTEHYYTLIKSLDHDKYNVLISGSQQEEIRLKQSKLANLDENLPAFAKLTLKQFITLIAHSDGLVASGTGPLHIGAALGINTLGIFPPAHGISQQRWKPIGRNAFTVAAQKACSGRLCCDQIGCPCMRSILPSEVKALILRHIKSEPTSNTGF